MKKILLAVIFLVLFGGLVAKSNNLTDAETYNEKGIAKYNLQDYKGAILDYDKAIVLNPTLKK